eukprot:CAMPEP_0203977166 /NCGR_PEP_ID=MMETSP0359-20131031/101478_1 /ASSEMBLY_ACC=CAM_ASM_000338 /TAXON_ID=268821 /ORGANISM="Scrippsiella Hangoei, Strain SHTV-5" /LENGTH=582 /DNA_ID=CAMNT_0050915375 /DNA_START=48 /DNA_END=1793 /DNA_ORIENTATION=+
MAPLARFRDGGAASFAPRLPLFLLVLLTLCGGGCSQAEDSADEDGCKCSGAWSGIQREMWLLFNHTVDLGELMDCLGSPEAPCAERPELEAPRLLLAGPDPLMQCSEEQLPLLTQRNAQACPAGMMHWMLLCAIQMWIRRMYRQSALYFDHALSFLSLVLDCLPGSDWPLWPGQVMRNWRHFLEAAFPPGKLKIEEKTAQNEDGDHLPPLVYEVAGPPVSHAAFQWMNSRRAGLYCPPHGIGGADGSEDAHYFGDARLPEVAPSVLCAVPLVWPDERGAAEVILEPYAPACDEVIFFVAAADARVAQEAAEVLEGLGGGGPVVRVVDLALERPGMVRDSTEALSSSSSGGRERVSGMNQKDLLLFEYLDRRGHQSDWVCRAETDAYFAPSNFRRFVAGRGLRPEESWFLGSISYWHMHFEPRVIFNEQVQCLSRGAVAKLAGVVRSAPSASQASYARCELAPGHRGDLMLALCLAEAGIAPSSDVVDRWGREFFTNYRLEQMRDYTPELGTGFFARDPRNFDTDAVMHWKGKAHFFMHCLRHGLNWVSPFPISFHNYKDREGIRWVHEVLSGQRPCGAACLE